MTAATAAAPFRNLVLSGGASKVLSVIGVVKCLEEQGHLQHVQVCVGTSAGAILGLLIVLGYDYQQMMVFVAEVRDNHLLALHPQHATLTKLGLDSGDCITQLCTRAMRNKLSSCGCSPEEGITFQQLDRVTGRRLVVCATNLTHGTAQSFSSVTHPSMCVSKAIRMSCSIPLIFTPVYHAGCWYVDGGLTNNVPVSCLKDQDTDGPTLVVWVSKQPCSFSRTKQDGGASLQTQHEDPCPEGRLPITWFVRSLINLITTRMLSPSGTCDKGITLLHLQLHSAPSTITRLPRKGGFGFDISPDLVDSMVTQGYQSCAAILRQTAPPSVERP
jgi:predicted acylesterase/phospholipase RssA